MQSKLRKALALLSLLAMLCTLLPMGAMSSVSAAETNLLVNGDFEAGNVGSLPTDWKAENTNKQYAITTSAQAHSGSYSAVLANRYDNFVLYQDMTVTANTQYTISFWYKSTNTSSSSGAFKYLFGVYDTTDVKANTSGSNGNNDGGTLIDASAPEVELDYHSADWTKITYTFNSGSATTVRLGFSPITCNWNNFNADSGSEFMYVDDVVAKVNDSGAVAPVLDKDWEDGDLGFKYGSIVAEGPNGSDCFNWTAGSAYDSNRIYVYNVEANATYIIKFKMKVSAGKAMFITIQHPTNEDQEHYYNETVKPENGTTDWAEYTVTTTIAEKYIGDGGKIRFKFQAAGTAQTIWVDDLTMTKVVEDEPDEPAAENLIQNGDFETGSHSPWEKWQSSAISTDAAKDGSYGVNLKGGGSWNGLLNQSFSVVNNATYDISLWYKVNKNGFTLQLIGEQSGTKYHNKSYKTVGDWTQLTVTITVSGDSTVKLNFSGIGGSGSADASKAEDVYIDSITVTKQKSASYDGYIYDGDFELNNLDANWKNVNGSCTATLVAGYTGNYALSVSGGLYCQIRQLVQVEANTDYAITLWAKDASNISVMVKTGSTDKNLSGGQKSFTAGSTWTKVTHTFNSGDNTSLYVGLMGTTESASAIIDDISMVVVKDPSFDGYIYNGDFETGSTINWKVDQSTALSTDAAKNGKYGIILKGDGGWGGMLKQNFTLEAGKTYKLSFWYKNVKDGVNMVIRDYDRPDTEKPDQHLKVVGNYLSGKTDWTLYEVTFKSGYSTNVYLNFSGSGKNNGDEMWVDDIKIENLSGDEMDRVENLKNSGVSIRDVDDDTRGLAFRFFVNVNGAQVVNGNRFVSGVGSMKLFEYADTMGTLIEAGAIVTNDAAKGTAGLTMESVDGGKTIKVPAQYLTDLSETDMGFAVRIINIPDKGVATQIYARPYYTYQLDDGTTYTIYGNTVDENYEHASSVRRSLKILAIGNSFSVDAMENHLYDVLKSADYDQVILGNLYIGGCSLNTHWNNINNSLSAYEFRKNDDNGTWVKTPNYTALTALQEENWDIITIQQVSSDSGKPDTYGNLQNIVNWIHQYKTNPNAKVMWHMTWAYQQDSTHEAFPSYGSNQMTMYNAIIDTAENTAMKVNGIDGIIPSGTAIQNLRTTALGDTLTADGYHLKDTYGDYAAALTWFRAITGESMDLVTYVPDSVVDHVFNIKRAAAHAVLKPYEITDLAETVVLAGSDFQASSWEKNISNVNNILASIQDKDGYELFDGLLFPGDFTPQQDHDESTIGIGVLDEFSNEFVVGNKVYSEGNHDAPTVEMLSPSGNNDPLGGTYGVYIIHEADYGQFGGGKTQQIADDLKAYFDEKIASGWDLKKPIFVMTHLPLHYNWRTVSDNGAGKNAKYLVDALNYGGEKGFNIIFLFGHNHSGDYDAYLGGDSIYLAKGDTMLIADPENYKNDPIETELKFTYLNAGYVGYFMREDVNTHLTMTTFKIQADGSVIITRYDATGYHNLKDEGVAHNPNSYVAYIEPNTTVYGPQRVVTATSDEEYTGN